MDVNRYKKLVDYYLRMDNREENYQNRILIPLLEDIFSSRGYDIIDSSNLTKEWDTRKIGRKMFADTHTPDILVAFKWKLHKDENNDTDLKMIFEVKTPTDKDRSRATDEVNEYLKKNVPVVLTDCINWEFYEITNEPSIIHLESEYNNFRLIQNNRYKNSCHYEPSIKKYPNNVSEGREKKSIKWVGNEDIQKLFDKIAQFI